MNPEAEAVTYVQGIVEGFGWILRRLVERDQGIDAEIELGNTFLGRTRGLGRKIGLQIKGGESYVTKGTAGSIRFDFENEYWLPYWLSYSVPVVIVVYSPEIGQAYWARIPPGIDPHARSFRIPRSQTLDGSALGPLAVLAVQGGQSLGSQEYVNDELSQAYNRKRQGNTI